MASTSAAAAVRRSEDTVSVSSSVESLLRCLPRLGYAVGYADIANFTGPEIPFGGARTEGSGGLSLVGSPTEITAGAPLSPRDLEALVALGAPSPFGRGQDLVTDPTFRSSVELPFTEFTFSDEGFDARVQAAAASAAAALGEPAPVKARGHKLLLYREGDLFKPHHDTEKAPGHFATMVVTVSSSCKGGILKVRGPAGSRQEFRLATAGAWAFFYASCEHEVTPVIKGTRLVLTYNVCKATHTCAAPGCGATNLEVDLKRCGVCKAAFYCGVDCQRRDWRAGHKRLCTYPQGATAAAKDAPATASKGVAMAHSGRGTSAGAGGAGAARRAAVPRPPNPIASVTPPLVEATAAALQAMVPHDADDPELYSWPKIVMLDHVYSGRALKTRGAKALKGRDTAIVELMKAAADVVSARYGLRRAFAIDIALTYTSGVGGGEIDLDDVGLTRYASVRRCKEVADDYEGDDFATQLLNPAFFATAPPTLVEYGNEPGAYDFMYEYAALVIGLNARMLGRTPAAAHEPPAEDLAEDAAAAAPAAAKV